MPDPPSLFGSVSPPSPSSAVVTANFFNTFQHILTTYPPILENVLLHLPTPSILALYQVNHSFRTFLKSYPLAWRNLSFRVLPPTSPVTINTATFDGSDISELAERPASFNYLLRLIIPLSRSLTRLDLDNSSVDGVELTSRVLEQRRGTLQHLSVRGCKRVSLRYHILPWLELETTMPAELAGNVPFVLQSLYVYRCRHHRRRPYLPTSLTRRDSDSRPTHQLIELCHRLGIWTDTAWCPTPGHRCYRRKDYYVGHHPSDGPTEVWVPFDRLWRSQNFVGRTGDGANANITTSQVPGSGGGRLWEDQETGFGGEQLGSGVTTAGEGKHVPTHLRRSHKIFVDNFKCDKCQEVITERCEQCSVRFHCMGCRKTLCASCAFDRPLKRKRRRLSATPQPAQQLQEAAVALSGASRAIAKRYNSRRTTKDRKDRFWWAPGVEMSPNVMKDDSEDSQSSDEDEPAPAHALPFTPMRTPRLDMHWCCLRPSFSGGGGIAFIGTPCGENVRAAPLPQGQGFEDPSFPNPSNQGKSSRLSYTASSAEESEQSLPWTRSYNPPTNFTLEQTLLLNVNDFDISAILEQDLDPSSEAWQKSMTPRSLCPTCYHSDEWRVLCSGCKHPLCIDHDVKSLKVRRCGYRSLVDERSTVQNAKRCVREGVSVPESVRDRAMASFYGKWNPIILKMAQDDEVRRLLGRWAPHSNSSGGWQSEEVSDYELPDGVYTAPPSRSEEDQATAVEVSQYRQIYEMTPLYNGYTPPSSAPSGEEPTANRQTLLTFSKTELPPPSDPPSGFPRRSQSMPNLVNMRPRSPSASSVGSTTSQGNYIPPPTMRWVGCNRYYCPSPRMPGDPRPRCSGESQVNACRRCGINVCEGCLSNPAVPQQCTCSTCSSWSFLCPNCLRCDAVVRDCRWEEEERERLRRIREDEEREKLRAESVRVAWLETEPERARSNEIAGDMGEFWEALLAE